MPEQAGSSKRSTQRSTAAVDIYVQSRKAALEIEPKKAGLREPGDAIYGVLLDMGLSEGTNATLVALYNGTSSMYTSQGGGLTGAERHPAVSAGAKALVGEVEAVRSQLSAEWTDGLLEDGQVRLIALTASGPLAVTGLGDDWFEDDSPMQPAFTAANGVIYRITALSMG